MNLKDFLTTYGSAKQIPRQQAPRQQASSLVSFLSRYGKKPKGGWVEYFAQTFPPKAATRLEALSQRALALVEEPEVFWSLGIRSDITAFTGGVTPQELGQPRHRALLQQVLRQFRGYNDQEAEDLDAIYPWRPWELLGIFSARDVPALDPNTPLSEADLSDIAEAIFMRAAESEDEWSYREEDVFGQQVPRAVVLQQVLRQRAGLSPLTRPQSRLAVGPDPFDTRIRVIDKATALERVKAWHKELPDPNYRGFLMGIGFVAGGKLRGVGIATTPSGRALADEDAAQRHIVDVSRIATDEVEGRGSVRGASSAIMRWFLRNADKLVRPGATEPTKVVTYSLLTEVGTTYASLLDEGLHAVGLTIPKTASGARRGAAGGRKETPKIRWEYGEEARPHQPHLLQLHRAYTAVVRDGRPLERRHFRGLDTPEALRDLARVLDFSLVSFKGADTAAARREILLARFGKQGDRVVSRRTP